MKPTWHQKNLFKPISLQGNSGIKDVHNLLKRTLTKFLESSDNGTEFKNTTLNDAWNQLGIKRIFSNPFHSQGNSGIKDVHNLLKRTLTKFLESSDNGTEFKNTTLNDAWNQLGIKRIFSNPFHSQGNSGIKDVHNLLKRTLTKFLESSDNGTEFKNTTLNDAWNQLGIKRIFSNPFHSQGNSGIKDVHNLLKRTLTKFLESSDNGTEFKNTTLNDAWNQLGIKRIFSNPFHSQGNSGIKDVHNLLKRTLTKFLESSDNGTEFKNTTLNDAWNQLGIKRIFSNPFHSQGNSGIKDVHNLLKRTLTKFLESSDL